MKSVQLLILTCIYLGLDIPKGLDKDVYIIPNAEFLVKLNLIELDFTKTVNGEYKHILTEDGKAAIAMLNAKLLTIERLQTAHLHKSEGLMAM